MFLAQLSLIATVEHTNHPRVPIWRPQTTRRGSILGVATHHWRQIDTIVDATPRTALSVVTICLAHCVYTRTTQIVCTLCPFKQIGESSLECLFLWRREWDQLLWYWDSFLGRTLIYRWTLLFISWIENISGLKNVGAFNSAFAECFYTLKRTNESESLMSKIDIPLVVVIPQIITAIYLRFSSATNSGSCSRLLPESNCFQVLGHPVDKTEVAKNSNIVNDL